MGGDDLNESRNMILLSVALFNLLVFVKKKKHILTHFALDMAVIVAARRRHSRQQRAC